MRGASPSHSTPVKNKLSNSQMDLTLSVLYDKVQLMKDTYKKTEDSMAKTKDLFIYQPETGAMIVLSAEAYLLDSARLSESQIEDAIDGTLDVAVAYGSGYRLDNFNMTNLFYGGAE